jgi:hypothetical protein
MYLNVEEEKEQSFSQVHWACLLPVVKGFKFKVQHEGLGFLV